MTDVWEDEGYAGEDDWGEESVEADLEEDQLEVELDELGGLDEDDEEDDLGGDFDAAA
jgi:hypothetical protein